MTKKKPVESGTKNQKSSVKNVQKKANSRKRRIDSPDEQLKVLAAATREIDPPEYMELSDRDTIHFNNIISEFAMYEWTDHKIELAALLAIMMGNLAVELIKVRKEGAIKKGDINPRVNVVNKYQGNIMAIRRSLGLHARAAGDPRDQGKRRGMAKSIETGYKDALEDDLIPRPTQH